MTKCERCEKAGDLACVQRLEEDGSSTLMCALHEDGTVEVPEQVMKDPKLVLSLLGRLRSTFEETCLAFAMLPLVNLSKKEYMEATDAAVRKLQYYGTMEGAVREKMRAAGMPAPGAAARPTQSPARA